MRSERNRPDLERPATTLEEHSLRTEMKGVDETQELVQETPAHPPLATGKGFRSPGFLPPSPQGTVDTERRLFWHRESRFHHLLNAQSPPSGGKGRKLEPSLALGCTRIWIYTIPDSVSQ